MNDYLQGWQDCLESLDEYQTPEWGDFEEALARSVYEEPHDQAY